MNSRKKAIGYFLILLCAVLFSTTELCLKQLAGQYDPMLLTALRFLVGGLCLTPMVFRSLKKRGRRLKRADFGFFMMTGLFFVVISMVLLQSAIGYIPASASAVLFSCNALFAILLAGVFLKEPLYAKHFVALAFEIAAVLMIVAPWQGNLSIKGVIAALAAALFYALYIVTGKRRSADLGGLSVTWGAVIFGSLTLLVLILLGQTEIFGGVFRSMGLSMLDHVSLKISLSWDALPLLLYVALVITGWGNVLHMIAAEYTSAREASLVFFLKPVLAPIFALWFLKEVIPGNMWIGIALFLIGSGVALLPEKEKKRA